MRFLGLHDLMVRKWEEAGAGGVPIHPRGIMVLDLGHNTFHSRVAQSKSEVISRRALDGRARA